MTSITRNDASGTAISHQRRRQAAQDILRKRQVRHCDQSSCRPLIVFVPLSAGVDIAPLIRR